MEVGDNLYSILIANDLEDAKYLDDKLTEFSTRYKLKSNSKSDNSKNNDNSKNICYAFSSQHKDEINICPAENYTLELANKSKHPPHVLYLNDKRTVLALNRSCFIIHREYLNTDERNKESTIKYLTKKTCK